MSITTIPRRALTAWREHRQQARDYASGADLLAAPYAAPAVTVDPPWWKQIPVVDDDWRCPHCSRFRCRIGREGGDCRTADPDERPAYAAGRAIPAAGKHDNWVAIKRWIRIDRLHQLRYHVQIAPGRYAARLGRPVMLPRHVAVLP